MCVGDGVGDGAGAGVGPGVGDEPAADSTSISANEKCPLPLLRTVTHGLPVTPPQSNENGPTLRDPSCELPHCVLVSPAEEPA